MTRVLVADSFAAHAGPVANALGWCGAGGYGGHSLSVVSAVLQSDPSLVYGAPGTLPPVSPARRGVDARVYNFAIWNAATLLARPVAMYPGAPIHQARIRLQHAETTERMDRHKPPATPAQRIRDGPGVRRKAIGDENTLVIGIHANPGSRASQVGCKLNGNAGICADDLRDVRTAERKHHRAA